MSTLYILGGTFIVVVTAIVGAVLSWLVRKILIVEKAELDHSKVTAEIYDNLKSFSDSLINNLKSTIYTLSDELAGTTQETRRHQMWRDKLEYLWSAVEELQKHVTLPSAEGTALNRGLPDRNPFTVPVTPAAQHEAYHNVRRRSAPVPEYKADDIDEWERDERITREQPPQRRPERMDRPYSKSGLNLDRLDDARPYRTDDRHRPF